MTRRPYKPRQYLYACDRCKQWVGVPTLDAQAQCRTAGACPRCQRNGDWLQRVKIAAIEEHLARLVVLGRAAQEPERFRLRALWIKKHQQLVEARAALAGAAEEVVG